MRAGADAGDEWKEIVGNVVLWQVNALQILVERFAGSLGSGVLCSGCHEKAADAEPGVAKNRICRLQQPLH